MAEIDSLEIKITSEAGKAKKSIDSLSKSLETLSKKLKFDTTSLEKLSNINGTGIKNLGVGVKTLASGMKELQGIKKTDFNRLATGIERLAAIQTGNIEAVGNALSPLADGINILSNAKFDNKNLTNLVNSLTRLSNANTSSLANIDFASLGNSINGLAQTLSKAEEVKQNTISMTNAVAKLANAGAGAGEAASALPGLGQNLGEFMNKISRAKSVETDTITFTQAVGTLANAGKKTETTANSLKKLGDELLKFFQTMSGAPNVSQNTIQMTQALSQLANAGGRTGSAVRGLGNVFTSSGISANTFNSGINKLSKSMNGLNGSIGKALGGIKNFSRSVLSAMGVTLGLYGTVRGAMKAMDISSDLTEVQNVVDATFGDMAYKVEDFAKTSIEQFGMSELSLKQYASRFQSMGAAMGINSGLINDANKFLNEQTEGYIGLSDSMSDVSLNMTKLTADMASLYNVEQKDVAKDLEAIFTGMTVPLRTYGLDLTQATLAEWAMKNGLDADIKSMSQAEKTMLRYQYVMANTTAAHNDFARTADTWANQTRIMRQNFEQLAAVIGGVLVNSFKPVVKVINAAMSHIIAFAKTISNALGQIFGWTYEEGGGGLAQDFGGAAEGAEDVADSTGTAAKNIDKMKKGIRAFDELKTIDFPEPSGETGGNGAGGAEGGAAAGEGLGGKWNPGESIIKKFTSDIDSLYKLGKYIGDALKKAMESIPWDSVYKKARNFGSGLAQFLNGLISPELFSALGKTIAGALNTALHFLDSFGETFDFENFGISIGAGINAALEGIDWETALSAAKKLGTGIGNVINGFFKRTDFSLVGSTLANALNTAIQFALSSGKKIDFELIGKKISDGINGFFKTFRADKLAKAINVWVKGVLKTVSTLLKKTDFDMIGKKIGKFLAELDLTGALKGLASVVWEAIKGAFNLLSGIFKTAPIEASLIAAFSFLKFTKVGQNFTSNLFSILNGGATGALNKFASFFNGGLLGVIGTAVAAFAEFSVVSDALENLTLGTGDFITEIGKIAGAVGLAWAGMSAILGFPLGTIATAIVGIVGAIKGINDAFKGIKAESATKSIANALKKPGGIPIEDLTKMYSDAIRKIKSGFDDINIKSEELKTTQANAEETSKKIDLIKFALDNGSVAAAEKTEEIKEAFDSLLLDSQSIFEQEYDVIMAGISGSLGQAMIDAGYSIEQIVGSMDSLKTGHQQAIDEIKRKNEELEQSYKNGEISQEQCSAAMLENYQKLGEITGRTDEYASAIDKVSKAASGVDLSGIVNKDNTINAGLLAEQFKSLSDTATEAKKSINDSSVGLTTALEDYAKEAERTKNSKAATAISDMLSAEKENVKSATESVNNQLTEYGNQVQYAVLERIPNVVDDAIADYKNKSPLYKFFNSEESHVQSALEEYQKNVIDPTTQELERIYSGAGIEGASFSSDAGKDIIDAMFDENIVSSGELTYYSRNLKNNYTEVVNNAVDGIKKDVKKKSKEIGENIDKGTKEGINKKLGLATGAIGDMANQMLKTAKGKLGVHSPSTKFKEIGGYVVEGMNGGISDKWSEFSEFWKKKYDSVINTFENIGSSFNKKGVSAVSGLKGGVGEKWGEFISDWGEKKKEVTGKYDSIKTNMNSKGKNTVSGLKGGIKERWKTFDTYWTGRKNSVVDKFENIKNDFEGKGSDVVSGLESGIGSRWDGFVKGLGDKIKSMVNGIIHGINWVLEKLGTPKEKWLNEWEGFATGSNGLPRDTIGIVNDQKGSVYKELIVPPHGKPFIPEGRNVMLPMEKGTKIMPARQTKDFMQNFKGFPHFAGGIGDFFEGAWAKISEFTGNIWDYISNPGKILQIAFDKFTDLSGMLEPVLSIAKGAASTLLDGATGFIKKMFDENLTVQYNPSQGVEQWRGLAAKALQMTGHFSALNLELMMKQIQTESSGNPRAINLYDANAKRGTPSKGLLQVIDPTFRAFALAPYNKDIWDPLSNMLAAIRYVVSKDGGIAGNWGKNKGYASGIGKINLADLIPKYRAGGFPEDGLFYANRTELVGRFSNGQTAVANNGKITQGIAEAIYPAVYNAVSSAMRNNGTSGSGDISLQLNLDGDAVYKNVVKRTREGRNRNIGGRLVLAEEVY